MIIFAGRFPSEKAAAIFVDLNARSLCAAGADVTVLAPRRLGRAPLSATPYAVRYLPTLDLSRIPVLWSMANFISVYVFAKFVFLRLAVTGRRDEIVVSNDAWPLLVASLLRKNTVYEMHDFAKDSYLYRTLFKRVRFVLATNAWKRDELIKCFGVSREHIILERNAVDIAQFGVVAKADARTRLNLEPDAKLVVYTGHLYEWKGADTLAKAAAALPQTQFVFVGGTAPDVASFKKQWNAPNIRIVGYVPHEQIPLWQSAADVLVLPNSSKEEISVHYTSPMKLFEYMASDRPIVASDLPSIREVLPSDAAYYAVSDDPAALARAIQSALSDPNATVRSLKAREIATGNTWEARASRILQRFIWA